LRAETAFAVSQPFFKVGHQEIQKDIFILIEDANVVTLFEAEQWSTQH
jgi:hypothetical protein